MNNLTRIIVLWLCIQASGVVSGQSLNAPDTVYIKSLLKHATELQNTRTDSCYLLASEAYTLSQDQGYPSGIRGACIRLGSVMLIWGKNDSALYFIDKAVSISRDLNDHKRIAASLMLRSYVFQNKGMQDSAFACLYEGMRYAKLAEDSAMLLQTRNAMADLYISYNDYPNALVNYKLSLQLAMASGDPYETSASMMGIGNVYYKKTQYHQALLWYLKADSILTTSGDRKGLAQNLNNIALCYAALNQPGKALAVFQSALQGYREIGMQSEEANLYYNLGVLYLELNKSDSAIYYLNQGLNLSRKNDNLSGVLNCLQELSQAWAQKGDYTKAYTYHVHYSTLNDSLLNNEKISSISEMQTKYETEKKEQQIALLGEQNKRRSTQRNFLIAGTAGLLVFLFVVIRQRNKVSKERKRSDKLLLNILPAEVAEELKHNGEAKARHFDNVTVLFTDFENFTGISEKLAPAELVAEIHKNFTAFDQIMEKHGIEKIKTIGDAYMAVSGLPVESPDHAIRMIHAAIDIRNFIRESNGKFNIRIGIHSGPVVAGIVGIRKYAYDIWGDTVNTAARMEQNSEAGRINVSGATFELTGKHFTFEHRGKIKAKNKGEIDMYFLEG